MSEMVERLLSSVSPRALLVDIRSASTQPFVRIRGVGAQGEQMSEDIRLGETTRANFKSVTGYEFCHWREAALEREKA